MPTQRGFVQKIEVGRAGLVRILLIHADNGSSGFYVIPDLDSDPERFNERLSKLAILRDAMDHAEPVEIEHFQGEAGEEIQTAVRISRDALAPVRKIVEVSGLVLDLVLHAENGATTAGEKHDTARITVLSTSLTLVNLVLDLQAPERLVVNEQFEMIRDAQLTGHSVRFLVDTSDSDATAVQNADSGTIVAVAVDKDFSAFGKEQTVELSGFVESLSLIGLPFLKDNPLLSNFAHVRFTTAPNFTGMGNVVGLAPFKPTTQDLLVSRNSLTYDLFKVGLRDNLRMRTSVVMSKRNTPSSPEVKELQPTDNPSTAPQDSVPNATDTGNPTFVASSQTASVDVSRREMVITATQSANVGIALSAELLAPLASASRPVWITIARESLDIGPDGYQKCTNGLPSSDLTPMSLRDLRIPYPAVWRGLGCFNPGAYRFQLQMPSAFKISVDGLPLCLHDSTEPGIKMAHACLHGEHEVTVEIDAWTCNDEFIMDVYRLR